MNKLWNYIINKAKWFTTCITDTEREGLSLSRLLFVICVGFAQYAWFFGKEIPHFQFYFILINLSYILFKDRSLAIINKIMDTIAIVRGGVPTPDNSQPKATETASNDGEQQLNG